VALSTNDIYLSSYPITRAEYQEAGSSACRRKFGGPKYNVDPPGFSRTAGDGDIDEHEQEMRYALGLDSIRGKGSKRKETEEVTSGNWGGRRRRAQEGSGMLGRR
jgi:actin-related protein 6